MHQFPRSRNVVQLLTLTVLALCCGTSSARSQNAAPDPPPPGDPAGVVAATQQAPAAPGPGDAAAGDGAAAADAQAAADTQAAAGDPPEDESRRIMSLSELAPPRGLRVNASGAFPGYTLFGPLNSTVIYLVDMAGEVVHRWETDAAPGAWCYLLDDGSLLRCGRIDEDPQFKGGGIGGRIQRLAPDGRVLWQWELADHEHQQHHDVRPMPNGHLLVIAWERKDAKLAVQHGLDPRQVHRERGFWPDVVYEVEPLPGGGAAVVWEWHAWDHLVQDMDSKLPDYGLIAEHPGRIDINGEHRDQPPLSAAQIAERQAVDAQLAALGYIGGADDGGPPTDQDRLPGDWLHTNAVDYHPVYDLLVLSSPHFDELWVIDHSTTTEEAAGSTGGRYGKGGDILWRWGNPRRYGAGRDEDRQLFGQHDPTWLRDGPPDVLRLLVFNNGRDRADGNWSSVDELMLPFDPVAGFQHAAGSAFGPAEPSWSYSAGDAFYSAFISGAQRLPNGNTLVCSGAPGRIFEVTAGGEVVWDYRNPHGGEIQPPEHAGKAPPLALFRAARYAQDHPGIVALLGAH